MVNILIDLFSDVILHQKGDYVLKDENVEVWFNGSLLFIYGTLNNKISAVETVDEEITSFMSGKYLYNNGTIIDNPNYIAPIGG